MCPTCLPVNCRITNYIVGASLEVDEYRSRPGVSQQQHNSVLVLNNKIARPELAKIG